MKDLLPFLVIGITTGAAYGLAATGLVITYKTSGIFNFAYGSVAAISIYVFYDLHVQHRWPWPVAALVCLAVVAPIQGLLLERLARVLDPQGSGVKVVATVGILLVVLGVGTIWYGSNLTIIPGYLPSRHFRMLGVNVGLDQIIVVCVSIVLTAALYWFFRYVRIGIAMRAVVDNAPLLSLLGESPARVRRWAWLMGSVFASLAGLMLAPSLSLDALAITMLVVQAFGAAAIGFFSSLPLTFLGGIFIGVAGSLATKYVVQVPALNGLPPSLPFVILILVLVFTPKARLVQRRLVATLPVQRPYYAPFRIRITFGGLVVAAFALIPFLVGFHLAIWTNLLIEVLLVLSLGLLVRTSGQISLCQFAFAAIGAATFSHFVANWHLPWLVGLLGAALIAAAIGALVAIPAIRLSSVFLALATLGFGVFVEQMFYTTSIMFGSTSNGLAAPRPDVSIAGWRLYTDRGFYYLVLVIVTLAVLVVIGLQRTRLGRLLRGLSDSPLSLEAYGTSVNVTRVLVFCISAAMASVSGALLGMLFHFSVGNNYDYFNSITLLAVVVITIGGDPWYALLAAAGLVLIPGYWTSGRVGTYLEIAFGVFAVSYAFQAGHLPTLPFGVRRVLDRLGGRSPGAAPPAERLPEPARVPASAGHRARQPEGTEHGQGLEIQNLTVRYGGIVAVRALTLSAPLGVITGLVGPNGAGKTTTFNACSGLVRPSDGRVLLKGRDVAHVGPSGRARRGLGRTFQKAQLFETLTVRDNIVLGREALLAGANPLRQMWTSPSQRSPVADAVEEALDLVGIRHLADQQAGLLPTGQKRLVELARALAGGFDVLLLDEPSSGLDAAETEHFGEVLTGIVGARGTAVLLVEHDMSLVSRVCHGVYVMDFGSLIFQGTTTQMAHSTIVKSAYLGEVVSVGAESAAE